MYRVLVVCLTAAALAGCRGSRPEPDAAVVAAIRLPDTPERIHAINQAVLGRRGRAASLLPLLAEQDPRIRRGAAYVAALWADDAEDVEALAPHLTDADDAIRAMIGGSLAGLGHAGARTSLASLTASPSMMPFGDPPISVGRFATDALAAIDLATGAAR